LLRCLTQSGRCSTHPVGAQPNPVGAQPNPVGAQPIRSVLHPHLILLPARAHSEHEASREQAFHVDGPSLCCNQRGQRSPSSSLSVLGQRRRQRRPDSQLVLPPWSVVRGSSSRGISNARLLLPALFFLLFNSLGRFSTQLRSVPCNPVGALQSGRFSTQLRLVPCNPVGAQPIRSVLNPSGRCLTHPASTTRLATMCSSPWSVVHSVSSKGMVEAGVPALFFF
jgi:hypothetical protein